MATRKSISTLSKELSSKINKAGEFYLDKQPADLGNWSGTVKVPDATSLVYARLSNGQVVKVFNTIAPAIYNWKVYIGRDKSQPSVWKVIESRWAYNFSLTINYIIFHHEQHEYPAADTVWVRRDQFMPLLVLPIGGFHVKLYGDVIYSPNATAPIRVIDQADIDLSAHVQVTGAKYVLIEVDNTGAVQITDGNVVDSIWILRYGTPIPTPTAGRFPICAIEMYEGQTSIQRNSAERNIIDLRMFTSDVSYGAGYQWHTSTAITTPADVDEMGIWNIAANALRKITWLNIKATLKTYFDTLYSVIGHTHTIFNDAEGDPADVTTGSAADGTSTYTARRDHVHHYTPTVFELIMESGVTKPPVPLENSAGDDWLYSS